MASRNSIRGLTVVLAMGSVMGSASAQRRAFRLPAANLKQSVIWGAECVLPDATGLAFGGQDRRADDGLSRTRLLKGSTWTDIHRQLRAANPLQKHHDRLWALRCRQKDLAAKGRFIYFQGRAPAGQAKSLAEDLLPAQGRIVDGLGVVVKELSALKDLGEYEAGQTKAALGHVRSALEKMESLTDVRAAVKAMSGARIELAKAAEVLDAEPPGRALSPIVYDAKTKLFVLFGGDHLDYLTNDTWVFDPARRKWMQRHAAAAPPPRAGHRLTASGDGKITLSGGYNYTSSTDYCGGQYKHVSDGDWTYDVAANAWTGGAKGAPPDSREYRTGPFHPDFYLDGPRPDAAATGRRLKDLPANTWVRLGPPRIPRLDRVWGSSVLDTDRDLILVWGGGHSSHGGSDVLHYHPATNRWELPFPVEFPLGQLYSNTSYPDSFNFNRRPWVTGHTYRSYGYDTTIKRMLFVGHAKHHYVYDPGIADWTDRAVKPKQMSYGGCFYDLTVCTTPRGAMAWGGYYGRAAYSKISRFDAAKGKWIELALTGEKLPGSVCDRSSMVYDSKRDRLLCIVKDLRAKTCRTVSVSLKSLAVKHLSPAGAASAASIGFHREFCYDTEHDLVVGTALPPGPDGRMRVPAYECAKDRWVSLKVAGPAPSGKGPRNVSLGLVYDPKRKLIWCVNNYRLQPYVLRLDPAKADLRPLP